MTEGQIVDDANFFKWLTGIILLMGSLLFSWTHARASSAHKKIDDDRRDTGRRFSLIDSNISTCKQGIDKDLANHMTEFQIKDFVDRSIKPLEDKIDAVHVDLKAVLREMK